MRLWDALWGPDVDETQTDLLAEEDQHASLRGQEGTPDADPEAERGTVPDGNGPRDSAGEGAIGPAAAGQPKNKHHIWSYIRETRTRLIRVEARLAIVLRVLIAGLLGLFITILGGFLVNLVFLTP